MTVLKLRFLARVATALAVVLPCLVVAQSRPVVDLPSSPRGLSAVQVGGTWTGSEGDREYVDGAWITIDYGRPILRGRANIFGAGGDYGEVVSDGVPVWRAGANQTTRLTTQASLSFDGKTIAPGVYNVFVDLQEDRWTFVLSTQPVQATYDPDDTVNLYGSYNYDREFDVLRAPMRMSTSPVSIEQFTIGFVDVAGDRGSIAMSWDRTVATVDFVVR
jgi:hypothetical protein